MNIHRSVLGAVAVALSLAATACPAEKHEAKEETKATAAPAPTPAPTPTPTAAASTAPTAAAADAPAPADTTPLPAPPADKVETEGKPPSPHHAWVHGFWHWVGKEYVWHAGYWEDTTAVATLAPPALRVEHPGVAPNASYFWAPGYWHWTGKEYAWAPGHWTVKRAGYAYVHPTYVEEKGKWVRRGFGYEKEDDAWKKQHPVAEWEQHGDLWVHKKEAADLQKRGHQEGWLHK